MKTILVLGGLIVVGAAAYYAYKNRSSSLGGLTNKGVGVLGKIKKGLLSQKIDLREEETISMRTLGSWLKEQDFPSFENYHVYVIKADSFPKEYFANASESYLTAHRYGFAVTDSDANILSSCLVLAKNVEDSFNSRIIAEVNEIHIKS